MPPSDSTATSVVPPPISTTIEPGGSVTRQPGPDRRRHRLLDEEDAAGTGAFRRFLDRAPFHRRRARGHADDDLRTGEAAPVMHLANEVLDHFLGDFEIGDDAVAQGTDGLD